MKLSAFRIRNFRSIVDTGWQSLSPDDITCLIGQNESGKTSVLEGLKVFYTGIISEDVLRSDLSLPKVSCRFSIPEGWLLKVTNNPGAELKELLSGLTHIELTRDWIADLSSVIRVSGEISQYLDSLENAWRIYLGDVTVKLEEELNYINDLELNLSDLLDRESEIKSKLPAPEVKKKWFSFFTGRTPDLIVPQNINYKELKTQLNDLQNEKERIVKELSGKQSMKKAGEIWKTLLEKCTTLENRFGDISKKLEERHQKMTLLMRPFDDDDQEWKNVLNDYRKTRMEKDLKKSELDRHIALSGYIMEGNSEAEAEKKVNDIIQSYKSQYNSDILGKKYFEYCPVFEMFEDFGSLLPNRIDMEDIIAGNDKVEGYKAARNFLTIAHLDYSFFQQPSSRILKQKIENLNQTLTLNFHDFWQQSIGRNNKIRIQFELEHYNTTYNEKAGKPYLEFWIKDEGERLYPKQRSRGVRWFISFYMELKASASFGNKPMILLVDEPGVSLHARAQEDVLKVFEDIKDRIQIIYTTHSPHLVDINKLHRVLAIQRDDIDSFKSNTRILDPLRLSSATPDTLTPLQSIMGNPFSTEGFSSGRLNLIVNDIGTFYFLTALLYLTGFKGKVSLIPSTDVSSIPLMCNILMGWGLRFAVILFRNEKEIAMADFLSHNMFKTETGETELLLMMPEDVLNAEDLLSTLDFKNNLLKTREGITIHNSVYLRDKGLPRNFILSKFLSDVKSGVISLNDLDEETVENFKLFSNLIKGLK